MARYLIEPVDELPFASAEKARRYATERYQGAVGPELVHLRSHAAARPAAVTSEPTAWRGPPLTSSGSAR